jgi:threonyl-tRNA synthetase
VFEEPESRVVETGEAILVLASVEKRDEEDLEGAVQAARQEIANLASQLKVGRVILNPFAHLFGELSRPKTAVRAMQSLGEVLGQDGLTVSRIPFGWFNTLEINAKGHPLSRVARIVPSEK